MAGIFCLAPLLSSALESTLAPLWRALGLDPAMLGGVLAIDMGGYQTAKSLAQDAAIGRYAGILVAATLGCTVTYTIPLGAGMLRGSDATGFYRGMLIGLGTLPIALLIGGAASGIGALPLIVQTLPVGAVFRSADAGAEVLCKAVHSRVFRVRGAAALAVHIGTDLQARCSIS